MRSQPLVGTSSCGRGSFGGEEPPTVRRLLPCHVRQDAGQAFSMLSSVASSDWSSPIQAVICFQKASAPTAPGIWSEPSNRNVYVLSVRSLNDSWSIGDWSSDESNPLFAEIQPWPVTLAFASAHC